jgi:hypothetical protein
MVVGVDSAELQKFNELVADLGRFGGLTSDWTVAVHNTRGDSFELPSATSLARLCAISNRSHNSLSVLGMPVETLIDPLDDFCRAIRIVVDLMAHPQSA